MAFMDTRTAWAQTSQSMPNTVMAMDFTSACATAADNKNVLKSKLKDFI